MPTSPSPAAPAAAPHRLPQMAGRCDGRHRDHGEEQGQGQQVRHDAERWQALSQMGCHGVEEPVVGVCALRDHRVARRGGSRHLGGEGDVEHAVHRPDVGTRGAQGDPGQGSGRRPHRRHDEREHDDRSAGRSPPRADTGRRPREHSAAASGRDEHQQAGDAGPPRPHRMAERDTESPGEEREHEPGGERPREVLTGGARATQGAHGDQAGQEDPGADGQEPATDDRGIDTGGDQDRGRRAGHQQQAHRDRERPRPMTHRSPHHEGQTTDPGSAPTVSLRPRSTPSSRASRSRRRTSSSRRRTAPSRRGCRPWATLPCRSSRPRRVRARS